MSPNFYHPGKNAMVPPSSTLSPKGYDRNCFPTQEPPPYVITKVTFIEPREPGLITSLCTHLLSPVRKDILGEIELLCLTFCTGMQDAATYPDYHCFASNQTGNTVLLVLCAIVPGVARSVFAVPNISLSLAFFLFGAFATGQIGNRVDCRRRLWILTTNLLQTAMVFAAAALQFRVKGDESPIIAGAIVALLACASGSQVVLSRSLNMSEISTAAATAAWVDLLIDPHMCGLKNRPRDRRALFLIALVAGSFVGAGFYRLSGGSRWSILISGVGKLLVTLMFLFNRIDRKGSNKDDA